MRSCEAIYGPEQADAIEELVVASTDNLCPCRRALPCPLLDEAGCNPLAEQVPRVAVDANRALASLLASVQHGT